MSRTCVFLAWCVHLAQQMVLQIRCPTEDSGLRAGSATEPGPGPDAHYWLSRCHQAQVTRHFSCHRSSSSSPAPCLKKNADECRDNASRMRPALRVFAIVFLGINRILLCLLCTARAVGPSVEQFHTELGVHL